MNSKEIRNQIKVDSGWTNEESVKNQKKVFTNKILDDEKFQDKEHIKEPFVESFKNDREDMEFRSDRKLTSKNIKILRAMKKVNDELKSIIKNKDQHCKLCKVMNASKNPFNENCQFFQDTYSIDIDGVNHSVDLVPQYLID